MAGASYVVQKVTDDGTPTGEVLAEGVTDTDGNAFAKLEEDTEVEFYFYHDPEGDPYEDPEAEKPLEEREAGFWTGLWRNISESADWVWGILKGDFEENPATSQIIGRMILTMIPGIDQLADVQDIVNILYRLIWKREYDDKWNWILLVIRLIGLILVLGSLAKGLLKLVFKKFGDISALRGLYGVFNFFSIGNAHRWLRDFASNLILRYLKVQREASIFIFPWREIPALAEFRVFSRDGQVVGGTQIGTQDVHSEIVENEDKIRYAIIELCYKLRRLLPTATLAADWWIEVEDKSVTAHLIELNQLVRSTDVGLFSRETNDDFDGTFRFKS